MKHFLFTLLLSSFFGAAILFLSPYVTGKVEPWNSNSYYYSSALFLAGFLILFDKHAKLEIVFIGIMLGQTVFMFSFMSVGPLVGVGLVIMAFKSLLSLVGLITKAVYLDIRALNGN